MASTRQPLVIDPSVAFGKQKISTSFAIQFSWLPVLKTHAHLEGISFSGLVSRAVEEYCDNHNVALPGEPVWAVDTKK